MWWFIGVAMHVHWNDFFRKWLFWHQFEKHLLILQSTITTTPAYKTCQNPKESFNKTTKKFAARSAWANGTVHWFHTAEKQILFNGQGKQRQSSCRWLNFICFFFFFVCATKRSRTSLLWISLFFSHSQWTFQQAFHKKKKKNILGRTGGKKIPRHVSALHLLPRL